MRRSRDGSQEVESFPDVQQLSEFPGFEMFNPRNSRLASRISGFARRLSLIDFGDEVQERVRSMTIEEQAKAARILSKGISSAAAIYEEAKAIRDGFSGMSIATLKGWTKHKGCPTLTGQRTRRLLNYSMFRSAMVKCVMRPNAPASICRPCCELTGICYNQKFGRS